MRLVFWPLNEGGALHYARRLSIMRCFGPLLLDLVEVNDAAARLLSVNRCPSGYQADGLPQCGRACPAVNGGPHARPRRGSRRGRSVFLLAVLRFR
jgi:hypothetical protein